MGRKVYSCDSSGSSEVFAMDTSRIESLKGEHRRLEQEIEEEYARVAPDDIHLTELKRRKLLLKDQIAALEQ